MTGVSNDDGKGRQNSRILEWGGGLVSALLVIGLVAYLVYLGFAETEARARLIVLPQGILRQEDGFHLRFSLHNDGGESAEDIHVGAVRDDGSVVAETVFSYLAPGSRRQGVFILGADPAAVPVTLRVTAYREP